MRFLVLLGAFAAVCSAQTVFPPFGVGGSGIAGNSAQVVNVAPAASMTFTATSNTITEFVAGAAGTPTALSSNVTFTVAGLTAGQKASFKFQQAASGGPYLITPPASLVGICQISEYPSAITTIGITWYGTYGTQDYCYPDRGPSQLATTTAPAGTPGPGSSYIWCWPDITNNTQECEDYLGNLSQMVALGSMSVGGVMTATGPIAMHSLAAGGLGTILQGGGTGIDPTLTPNPQLGSGGAATGTLGFCGITSGCPTITPNAVAGTGTLTIPANVTGTLATNDSTQTAGSGGVTANLIAAKDASNPTLYVLPGSGGCGSGIALGTAASTATFQLAQLPGFYTMVADGTITAGHILTGGSSTVGRVADTGQTARASVPGSTCIVGVAQASATVGQTLTVKYDGPGSFGAGIQGIPITAGAACTVSGGATFCVCTTTCTITVPVPTTTPVNQFCVYNDDNVSTVITLSAIGSSARYENQARTAYGTAGTGTLVSGGAVGDSVCLVGRDATHYSTLSAVGAWTAN